MSPSNTPLYNIHVCRKKKNKNPIPEFVIFFVFSRLLTIGFRISENLYYAYFVLRKYVGRCFDSMLLIHPVLVHVKVSMIRMELEDDEDSM